MNNTYEIVFENIVKNDLFNFIIILCKQAKNYTVIGTDINLGLESPETLQKTLLKAFAQEGNNVCLSLRLYDFNISNIVYPIPLVLLRIIKYENIYDVDLSFDYKMDADIKFLMKNIYSQLSMLSSKVKYHSFYGGEEPAKDIENRYFTDNEFI